MSAQQPDVFTLGDMMDLAAELLEELEAESGECQCEDCFALRHWSDEP